MVTDVVMRTLEGGLSEVRMSDDVLDATIGLRSFLFEAVYENDVATAEFKKAAGILGGLWEKVRENPKEFLDQRTIESEGLDVATKDFVAGMTDRYAVNLYEQLFIPKPWVSVNPVQIADPDLADRLPIHPIPIRGGGQRASQQHATAPQGTLGPARRTNSIIAATLSSAASRPSAAAMRMRVVERQRAVEAGLAFFGDA